MRKIFALVIMLLAFPGLAVAGPRQSLFFTSQELSDIMRANRGFLAPKPVKPGKEKKDMTIDRGRRVITLSGIIYNGKNDWTIWLNGQRVTPKNIPPQVKALSVSAESVTLKWDDTAMVRLVNLTLRPHQQYNLDTNVITPGT